MKHLELVIRYVRYLLKAKGVGGLEPFLPKGFVEGVLQRGHDGEELSRLLQFRKSLLSDERWINITDLGAGSRVNRSNRRQVKDIARHSSKPVRFTELFYRLTQYLGAQSVVELGTSLGISTAYLASGAKTGRVVSIEGCPETAAIAQGHLQKLGLPHAEVRNGEFSAVLPQVLQELRKVDVVYVDGNHLEKPTVQYFEQCLSAIHENTVLIFDDIHWSKGMEAAWEQIKSHEKVTVSIDLFFVGLVFFHPVSTRKEFVVRY